MQGSLRVITAQGCRSHVQIWVTLEMLMDELDDRRALTHRLAGEKVVAAEPLVGEPVLEHVVGADKDRVGDGDDRLLVSTAATYAQVLGAQVGVLGAPRRALGGPDQGNPQPAIALARLARAALAGGLVMAGTDRGQL